MLIYTCQEFEGLFFFLACPTPTLGNTRYCTRQTFFFPFNSSISWEREPLYTVDLLIHVPISPLHPELGKASMKPLVSHNRNLLYHRLKLFMGDVCRQFWKTRLGVIFSWCPGVPEEAAAASGKQFLSWRC